MASITVTTRSQASEFRDVQGSFLAPVLPQDVIVGIFSKMSRSCLFAIASTCKYYNALSKDDLIWTNLFHKFFPCPLINSNHSFDAYKKELALHKNLKNGAFTWHQLAAQEKNNSIFIDITKDRYLAISASDVILCGNIKSNEKAQEVPFDVPDATHCIAAGGKLIVGFKSGDIQIFGPDQESPELQFVCEKAFTGHTRDILLSAFGNGILCSYSADHTIRIWDAASGDCIALLEEFGETFEYIVVKNDKIFAGTESGDIKIWNIKSLDSVITLSADNEKCIICLAINDNTIYASYEDGPILTWDIETRNYSIFTKDHDAAYSLKIAGDKLITENGDGILTVWDLPTKKCFPPIFLGKTDSITPLAFAEGRLIFGLESGDLAVLDFNAPEEAILKELACLFNAFNMKDAKGIPLLSDAAIKDTEERFLRISDQTRHLIYRQFYNHFSPFGNKSIYFEGIGEAAWSAASGGKRSIAIDIYLRALSRNNLSYNAYGKNFLLDLGIASLEDFTRALHRSPDFLPQVGILSSQDLEAVLDVCPRPVAHLKLLPVSVKLPQDCLPLQREILASLKGMGTGLHARAMGAFKNSMPSSKIPWESFLKKIDDLYAVLEIKCETEAGLLDLFEPEFFSLTINAINELIDVFNALDQRHLREKLHAYVSQENLVSVWHGLRARGIDSLTKLVFESDEPITEEYLFQMGRLNNKVHL